MKVKETTFAGQNPTHAEVELEVVTLMEGPVLRVRIEAGNYRYYNLDRSQFLQLATECIAAVNVSDRQ
jgi:hypothetical protein